MHIVSRLCSDWILATIFGKSLFFMSLLPSVSAVDQHVLMESFLQYIDPSEADAVNKCLQESENAAVPEFENVVVPMLARFNSCRVPKNSKSLREVLINVASYTCVSQPHLAACEMKRGMLSAHPQV